MHKKTCYVYTRFVGVVTKLNVKSFLRTTHIFSRISVCNFLECIFLCLTFQLIIYACNMIVNSGTISAFNAPPEVHIHTYKYIK